MKLSRTAKVVLTLSAVLAIFLFLVIVDLGVSAGRIHYGVRIDHIDLGGMTEPEAVDVLEQRGLEMDRSPIFFHKQGVKCHFLPLAVGWSAKVHRAVDDALDIGRAGSLIHAGRERLVAWFGGVKVDWSNEVKPTQVGTLLDRCQKVASSSGLQIARRKMRQRIKHALVTWPRRRWRIPLIAS